MYNGGKAEQDYLASKGTVCPYCGSKALEGQSIESGEGTASQEMECLDCMAVWDDVYKLIGFSEISESQS